ncbi:hypothetical protein CLU79DRAFT_753866 [Phycomyces nitens]|nr:hypothetical protein CLU79DRAFT_753866 [Phycomyces nitens]
MANRNEWLDRYARAEVQFFQSLSPDDKNKITEDGQTIKDCLLYGEMGFVLAGLKPCVLIHFNSERINTLYQQNVLDPLARELDLRVRVLPSLKSEEMDLTGGLIVDRGYGPSDELWECGPVISEESLARILDYPGSLPKTEEEILTMLEVAYVDSRYGYVVTTFAGQTREEEKIRAHFRHYKEEYKNVFGIELQLIMRRPLL